MIQVLHTNVLIGCCCFARCGTWPIDQRTHVLMKERFSTYISYLILFLYMHQYTCYSYITTRCWDLKSTFKYIYYLTICFNSNFVLHFVLCLGGQKWVRLFAIKTFASNMRTTVGRVSPAFVGNEPKWFGPSRNTHTHRLSADYHTFRLANRCRWIECKHKLMQNE